MRQFRPMFSVKYENPRFPDEDWAVDWNWELEKGWGISRSSKKKMHWEKEKKGLDGLAHTAVLKKFGLFDWGKEYPIKKVEVMSPAALTKERRKKEEHYSLPRLNITADNRHFSKDKDDILHHAEDYK